MSESRYDAHVTAYQWHGIGEILRAGGTLVLHPDAWRRVRAESPTLARELQWWEIAHGTKVMTSPYLERGQVMAYLPKKFSIEPDFNFSEVR